MSYGNGALKLISARQMAITESPDSFQLTGVGDPALPAPKVPTPVANLPANGYTAYHLYQPKSGWGSGLEVDGGRMLIKRHGKLLSNGYADMSHSANNTTVGIIFGLERDGVVYFSERSVHAKMPNSDDYGHLAGIGMTGDDKDSPLDVQPGDRLGIYMATDLPGMVNLYNSTVVVKLYAPGY